MRPSPRPSVRRARAARTAVAAALVLAGAAGACRFGVDLAALERCAGRTDDDCASDDAALDRDAGDDRDDRDGARSCPSGRGPAMVRVDGPEGGRGLGPCVDRTEVTNDDFAAFLAAEDRPSRSPDGGARACAGRTSFVPARAWPPAPGRGAAPVTDVDLCEAAAYCAWAGKRLCGALGGGPLDARRQGDPSVDVWTLACSGAGAARAYPYGATYDPSACNGVEREAGAPLVVGSMVACQAPSGGGPLDLSGNVWEWTDACESDTSDEDACWVRGGAFNAPAPELACAAKRTEPRGRGDGTIGIRCCAP